MKIFIKAKPDAWENLVEKIDDTHFVVSVKEPPIQGRANRAIVKLLADYFKTTILNVKIVSGHTSRNKIIVVE